MRRKGGTRRAAAEIGHVFDQWKLDDESRTYLDVHCRRYAVLLETIASLEPEMRSRTGAGPMRVLDVGPGYQTELIRRRFSHFLVDTLGFEDSRLSPGPGERHCPFDLNDASDPAKWPTLPPVRLIVLAEVLEHLYTSPLLVFRFLSAALVPSGFLLVQTPNACALNRRVKMLLGKNPLEPIRETRTNPGHFHEYTAAELRQVARQTGLEVHSLEIVNYFDGGSRKHAFFNQLSTGLPASLREGVTMVLRRPAEATAGGGNSAPDAASKT